jgi:autotransporter-associated beta strand protein
MLSGDGVIDASGSGALTLNPNANYGGRSVGIGNTPWNLTLQGTGAGVVNGVVRIGQTGQAYGGFLAGSLVKKGAGAWTLNGTENILQELDIRGGTVELGHASNTLVDNARVTVAAGATLGIGTNSDKVGVVTLKDGTITGSGTLQGLRYDVESGVIECVLAGVVSALTKTTSGTLALAGANTYLGDTLVKAGTLISTNRIAGDVTVDGGAALQASGAVGGNLTLNGALQVDATTMGTLAVGGALTLSGPCVVTRGTQPFIITAASRTGTFASITPPFYAVYSPSGVIIAYSLSGAAIVVR